MPAVPSWPTDQLPAPPLNDSYQIDLPDNLARTPMEQGNALQRNKFRSGYTRYHVTWPMLAEQFGIFRGIQRWLLAANGRWFSIPCFEGATSDGSVNRTVRFVKGPIAPTRTGGEWMTSAVLETLDNTTPTEDATLAALIALGQNIVSLDDLFDGSNTLVWPETAIPSKPLNDSYTLTLPDDLVRSDLDQGFQDQDSPFRSGVTSYANTLPMTDTQFLAFRGLLGNRLADGNAWFKQHMFDREDYFPRRVRLVKTISATRDGDDWLVPLNLETVDDTAMDYATTQAALT